MGREGKWTKSITKEVAATGYQKERTRRMGSKHEREGEVMGSSL